MNDNLKLKGEVLIETRDRVSNKILSHLEINNLIVNVGKEYVAKLLGGIETDGFCAIAIGEGTTAPVGGNSALESEVEREVITPVYVADYKIKFEKTFVFGTGISYAITEAGVFNSGTVSGSTMLNRVSFGALNVGTDINLYIRFTITVS